MVLGTAIGLGVSALAGRSADKERERQEAQLNAEAAAERDRQERIRGTVGYIDRIFDSPDRQRQYGDFVQALRGYLGDRVGRQKEQAGRKRKFAIAKAGQTGGSLDYDTQGRLGEEFADATLEAERAAQGSLYDLKSSDEQQRQNLIGLARSGLDATTAGRRATSGQQASLTNALASGQGQRLGDLFGSTLGTHRRIQERGERRRGFGYGATRADIYGGTA